MTTIYGLYFSHHYTHSKLHFLHVIVSFKFNLFIPQAGFLNLGPCKIAVFEDCKATAPTNQPPWLAEVTIYFKAYSTHHTNITKKFYIFLVKAHARFLRSQTEVKFPDSYSILCPKSIWGLVKEYQYLTED